METGNQQVWPTVLRATIIYSIPEGWSYEQFGEAQINATSAVFHQRTLFEHAGRMDLERDLSLIATTQFECSQARSDYDAIAAGTSAAAKKMSGSL